MIKKCLGVIFVFILLVQVFVGLPVFKGVVKAAALSTDRVSVHDPSIVKADGKYYIFGSHMSFASSENLSSWKNFTTNINSDYANIFAEPAKWSARGSASYDVKGNLWAPDVIYNKKMKKWCMYMSVNGERLYSSIVLATADRITGPYTYAGTIVYSGFTNEADAKATDYRKVTGSNEVAGRYLLNGAWNTKYGTNAIDPCLIYDKKGNLWMSYGSWFGGIYMLKMDENTGLRDYTYKYTTKYNYSDQYLGLKLSGGHGCTGEGSYIVYDKETGYYYLYLSYCGLNATDNFSGYHLRLFRSKDIKGPYKDAAGNDAICTSSNADQRRKGIKLFGNYSFSSLNNAAPSEFSSKGYKSGGHNSAFVDNNGQRYLVYHTRFNKGEETHQVRVHQQFINEDGWPVTAVYEYSGSIISKSGYSKSKIAGTYEIVNHGNDATTVYTGMLKTSKVVLQANGKITGDYNGTWKTVTGADGNKYYCTMIIDGVTYKGVFFKQYNESINHKNTMTFSLIGNNNQSIWGSKIR
ncbi:glycoside hydrolase family 43 protein [Anaerosacchariphilus polymeriproducens]|nr:glycoside hydrolase family 43 protein [Anaerosacchariphilus polymeriproducens]